MTVYTQQNTENSALDKNTVKFCQAPNDLVMVLATLRKDMLRMVLLNKFLEVIK